MTLWMLAIAAVVAGSLLPAADLPSTGMSDKTEHFLAYGLLSASAVQLFRSRLSLLAMAVLLVLLGIGLEGGQAAMGVGRVMDRYDALANSIGVLIGLLTQLTPARDLLVWIDRRL